MSTSDTQPTWIEFTITSDETRVFVSVRGSRWEQLPRRDLGISRDKLEKFARDIERAAAYGQPLGEAVLADAQAIHKALLDGDSGVRFGRLCEAGGGSLLVRFVVEDPPLRAVPWEALCNEGDSLRSWGTSANVFPVRGVFSGDPWHPRDVNGAIKVLAIAPTGSEGLANLKLALAERIDRGEVEWLEPLEGPITRVPAILGRLRQGPAPHVVHFLGHGRLAAPNRPELRMADDSDGEEKWIAAGLFAEQLKAHFRDNLRLILLEACEGAKPGAFASAAEILAGAGADAVVAHLWPVRADAAQTFSTQFYRALTEAHQGAGDVLFAANEGRRAVLGAYEGSAQALSPVVVLRGPDGKVFHFEQRDELVRPSTTLPPIVERLPKGDEGAREFEKLVSLLLRQRAAPDGLVYDFEGIDQANVPPAARRRDDLPRNNLLGFRILWIPDDVRHRQGPKLVSRQLLRQGERIRHIDDTHSTFSRLCLIFPRDIKLEELKWIHRQPKWEGYTSVEVWGMAHLEKLLRPVPALFARYYPELAARELAGFDPSFNFRTFTTHYCEEVVRDKEHVNLLGFPPEALRERDAKANIRLADLFVPTVFRKQQDREKRTELAPLLNSEKSVLVLGDPGMGKTMLLLFLALLHARGSATLPNYTPPPRRIPIFISLREYALAEQDARKEQKNFLLLDYLTLHYKTKRNLDSAHPVFFEAALRMGEAIVLLDGLDEVGSSAARKQMAARLRDLRREYPGCPIWVTSRIHGYTHDIALPNEEFEHVMIGALDDAQIDDFLSRWYAIQIPHDAQKQAEQKNSLRQAIFRTKQVEALARNPLLLTLMAFVHRFLGHLPQDRGELYDKCIEMLLRSWLEARDRPQKHAYEELALSKELPRDYLEALAYHVQDRGLLVNDEANEARGLFSRDDALAFLTTHHAKNDRRSPAISPSKARQEMHDFIDYACDRVGLLADRGGGNLSFLHLSFQEYLAAAYETVLTTIEAQQSLFAKHFRNATWSEVLLLRLYLFAQKRGASGRDILDKLVSGMLDDLARSDSITAWLLLGRALRDRHNLRPEHRKTILERLVQAWAITPTFGSDVSVVLEDIRLFATNLVQAELQAACAQVQLRSIPHEAMAALHLELKLFGDLEGAAQRLDARTDLSELLADVVVFLDVPEIAALLAKRATIDHWETAFAALPCEDVYRWTVELANGMVACTVHSDTPTLAATRWLRRKINAEVESREHFACQYHAHFGASLFVRPGTLRVEDRLFRVEFPLAYATISPTTVVPCFGVTISTPNAPNLMCQRWRAMDIAYVDGSIDPLTLAIRTHLTEHASFTPDNALAIAENFVLNVARRCVWSFETHGRAGSKEAYVTTERRRALVNNAGCAFATKPFTRTIANLARDILSRVHQSLPKSITVHLLRYLGEYERAELGESPNDLHNIYWFGILPANSVEFDAAQQCTCLEWSYRARVAIPQVLVALSGLATMCWLLMLGRHLHARFPNGDFTDDAWDDWLAKNPIWSFWSALAWNEHAKLYQQNHGKLDGAHGALMLAHADYASMMTGIDLENAEQYPYWKNLVDEAGPEKIHALRHYAPALTPTPARVSAPIPTPAPAPAREPAPLFTYLHLSDLHFGLPKPGDRHNQPTVLTALRDEFATLSSKTLPPPEAIFITGDIAYSGKAADYEQASKWIDELLKTLGLTPDRVFVVPGNHDVNRDIDADRKVNRLMRHLRDGDDVDDALVDQDDRDLLLRRKEAYLEFAKRFAPARHFPSKPPIERLVWTHQFKTRSNLNVHIVGLDTALLAADRDDPKRLRLGQTQIARLNQCAPGEELVIVLGHHPLNKEWLHPDDERDLSVLLRRRAHLYLAGHVHDHDSEHVVLGGGSELVRVIAGASYGGRQHDIRQGHAYSIGAVMPPFDDKPIRLRIYPRRFSFKNGDFRTDTDNVPEGKTFAEFELKDLILPIFEWR